jgi:hypothetical protein
VTGSLKVTGEVDRRLVRRIGLAGALVRGDRRGDLVDRVRLAAEVAVAATRAAELVRARSWIVSLSRG